MGTRTPAKILLPCLLILLGAGPASAAKIYQSRDTSGRVVFSDKPVADSEVIETRQIELPKGPCFSVLRQGTQDDLRLQGVNDCYGPVEFEFTLSDFENISSDRAWAFRVVIPARTSQHLVHLWPSVRHKGYKYTTNHRSVIGDPRAIHRPPRPYLLPIPAKRTFPISQGFKGSSTHTHPQSEYAVDIPMPVGTPIHAARSGIVMDVANDFFTGGAEARFNEKANFIRILHEDGTMALYAHLQLESIRYPIGARVEAGQFIGASGDTGYSSGPHLHFAVQKNFGMELRSIPFEFEHPDGSAFTPAAGMTVRR